MKSKVIDYYKKAHIDYQLLYFRHKNYAMNYGFWDKSTKNRHQALLNLNKVISKQINLNSKNLVLDAGCGLGETSFWFAKNINCQTVGISIAPNQIKMARQIAKKRQLELKTSFKVVNYTKTRFSNNHFDAIVALETICHLQDKSDFYKEAFRILKPGGKLAIAEYYLKKSNLNNVQRKQFNHMLKGWIIPNLWTKAEHLQSLNQIGFCKAKFKDYSKHTIKTSHFLYHHSLYGIPLYRFLNKIKLINQVRLYDALACKYQWLTKKQNIWGHSLIVAQKPV